jgi:hypothetical protein
MPDMEEEICIPWFAEKMFYMILPKVLREHVMGDLQEEFYGKVFQKYSLSRARWWYRGQVLKSIRYYILNRKGDIMFFLFSILVFVGISLAAAFLGSNISYFINLPSIIVVVIPSFVFALAATSLRAWRLCLKLLFIDEDYSDQKKIREASRFLNVFGNMCVAMGLFYTLLAAEQVLQGVITESIGTTAYMAAAVCLLALFYGIGLKSVLYIADQRIQNRFLS